MPVTEIASVTIWGNHSATQYPDLYHAEVGGKIAAEQVDEAWLRDEFIPRVAKRGAEIIEVRGASSAASAANAAIDHVFDWVNGTAGRRLDLRRDPVRRLLRRGRGHHLQLPGHLGERRSWEIVQGLEIDEFSRERIDASVAELREERDAVKGLGLI